jgi:hypothetical protein
VHFTFEHLTPKSIRNIFLPWILHICKMITVSGKDNFVAPGKRCSTPMSIALDLSDFDPKNQSGIYWCHG